MTVSAAPVTVHREERGLLSRCSADAAHPGSSSQAHICALFSIGAFAERAGVAAGACCQGLDRGEAGHDIVQQGERFLVVVIWVTSGGVSVVTHEYRSEGVTDHRQQQEPQAP